MSKLDYVEIIEGAKKELQNNENRYYKKKSEIINQLADKLSQIPGIELHKISAIITQELEGIVSPRYIREALPAFPYMLTNQSTTKSI